MYVLTDGGGNVDTFPYSDGQLRASLPNVSLPNPLDDTTRAIYDVYPVIEDAVPVYNELTHKVELDAEPTFNNPLWNWEYTTTALTAPEIVTAIANAIALLQAQLNFKRDTVQLGGVPWSTYVFPTSPSAIGYAFSTALYDVNPRLMVLNDGTFLSVDLTEQEEIREAYHDFVQAVIDREAVIQAIIDTVVDEATKLAADIALAAAIDVGWPPNA